MAASRVAEIEGRISMDITTIATLAVIALIDSTSIGTLVVPLWLMLDSRRSASNVILYLAALSGFYFAVGAVLMLGARYAIDAAGERIFNFLTTTTEGGYVVLAIGISLIVVSFAIEPKRRERIRAARGEGDTRPWTERISARPPRARSTIALALGAGALEVATMVPYLAAIGIIASADVSGVVRVSVLAGYVVVMAVPAAVLLTVRRAAGTRVNAKLERMRAWLMKHSAGTISLLLLILGINVAIRGAALIQ
ncbi:GAP family protein [Phytoactinopolyspora mesophila]|uniref:GAP family protein n=1 Tax=Phytoactinopolyspora mesophila TaxID=2650750 RepID=A0A7K3LXM1_9ACTN|nr:GAP family protein [Phytoactinopolyspora mesophila]NDL55763.1 hypothetical protein [Phytoactinopolyspora mesophila]